MRIARFVFAVAVLGTADGSAQVAPTAPPPQPAAPAVAAPGVAPPAAAAPGAARAFLAPAGLILNAVRPERVVDFELVIGYLQAAFATSASPQLRAQGQGWRMFKATEPGPNNTVLYVFLLDPTVVGADYGLGPILSDAYPDQVEQIWKLYQGALAGPGSQSLLNLTSVEPPPLPPAGAPVPAPGALVPAPAVPVPAPGAPVPSPGPGTAPAAPSSAPAAP